MRAGPVSAITGIIGAIASRDDRSLALCYGLLPEVVIEQVRAEANRA